MRIAEATFTRLNALLALGHFAAAIAVWTTTASTEQWYTPVKFVYNKWTESIEPDSDIMYVTTESVDIGDFYPGVFLPLCSVFSGLHHLAAIFWKGYYSEVGQGFSTLRWLDYSFSAPLMLVVNEVLWIAYPDVSLLASVAFVQMLICVAGAAIERSWMQNKMYVGGLFLGTLLPFLMLWFRYGVAVALANEDGASVPVFVWFFLLFLMITFWLFPVVFGSKILFGDNTDVARNYRYEARFLMLSAIAKIPLLSFFAFGTSQRSGRVVVEGSSGGAPSDEDSLIGVVVAGAVTVVVIVVFGVAAKPYFYDIFWPWRRTAVQRADIPELKRSILSAAF